MSDKIEITVTHKFTASPERVYDVWLDPDKARIWQKAAYQKMGLSGEVVKVEIDPVVGGAFLFTDMRDGVETRHSGTYLELDRPNKIVFTWITDESEESDPSKVTMTIKPDGAGCIVVIVHELDSKWSDYIEQTENGWSILLQASVEVA